MRAFLGAAISALFLVGQSSAVPQVRIVAGEDIAVTSNSSVLSVEAHLAVHPADPTHLVAAAMEFGPASPGGAVAVHVSRNGGTSWARGNLSSESSGADPWLAFDPSGALYMVQLNGRSDGLLWRSTNGGMGWDAPLTLPAGEGGPYDYPKVLIDSVGGKTRLAILATQTGVPLDASRKGTRVVLLTSTDGRQFTRHVIAPSDITHQNGVPAVLTTGRIVAPFHELGHGSNRLHSPRLLVATFDPALPSGPPILVAEQFLSDSPFFVADVSASRFRDRVYAGWMGLAGDVHHYVAHSTNGGTRWSKPIRLNDSSEAKRIPTHHPMMAVNRDGVLGLTWYDAREDAEGKCFKLYFSASLDGGESFLPNVPVSSAPSCPQTQANELALGKSGMTVRRRFKEGGDYHGLVALPDGSFQAIWSDSRSGTYQLRTTRIRIDPQ